MGDAGVAEDEEDLGDAGTAEEEEVEDLDVLGDLGEAADLALAFVFAANSASVFCLYFSAAAAAAAAAIAEGCWRVGDRCGEELDVDDDIEAFEFEGAGGAN